MAPGQVRHEHQAPGWVWWPRRRGPPAHPGSELCLEPSLCSLSGGLQEAAWACGHAAVRSAALQGRLVGRLLVWPAVSPGALRPLCMSPETRPPGGIARRPRVSAQAVCSVPFRLSGSRAAGGRPHALQLSLTGRSPPTHGSTSYSEATPCALFAGCAAQRNFCDGAWCQNGGACVSRWNTYLCECPLGFGGKNCEQGEGLALSLSTVATPAMGDPPGAPHVGPAALGGMCVHRWGAGAGLGCEA